MFKITEEVINGLNDPDFVSVSGRSNNRNFFIIDNILIKETGADHLNQKWLDGYKKLTNSFSLVPVLDFYNNYIALPFIQDKFVTFEQVFLGSDKTLKWYYKNKYHSISKKILSSYFCHIDLQLKNFVYIEKDKQVMVMDPECVYFDGDLDSKIVHNKLMHQSYLKAIQLMD